MSDATDTPSGPPPQNALERLMARAAEDPALQGEMFRQLWEAEVFTYVPPHPELIGEHTRTVDQGFTWCTLGDSQGPFAPVFTSDAAASHEIRRVQPPRPMICALPAKVLFHFFNDGKTTALVMAAGGATIRLQPAAIASLVSGEFTHNRVSDSPDKQTVMLRPVPDADVPAEFAAAIRRFCDARRVPIGVYVFNQADLETGEYPQDDLCVVLWLRDTDNDFYNDFCLMAQRLTPPHLQFFCAAATAEDTELVEFLQKYQPLWPVTAES